MIDINQLSKPKEFWKYFQKISEIPRCSGNEDQIRAYIKKEAEKFDFKTLIDEAGNLLVKIPSKNKNATKIILQSHFDMVCEKRSNAMHNFSKDPLKLKEIEENEQKWITAEGTSLGADNGVGLAYSLALMKFIYKNKLDFNNLDIRLLFTVNEEEGLIGAFQISPDILDVDYLINLDCMDAQTIIIGSVGGMYSTIQIRVKRIPIDDLNTKLIPVKLSIKGLLGGHSGLDIDKGRANAIKLLARVLRIINKSFDIYMESISGGKNFNAIPREASATMYIEKENFIEIAYLLNQIQEDLKIEYDAVENQIKIVLEKLKKDEISNTAIIKNIQEKILNVLFLLPHGPISKHPLLKDLVHTSTNLAAINTKKSKIKLEMLHRSFNLQCNSQTAEKISALLDLAELNVRIKNIGGYGVWEPNFDEKLLSIAKKVYEEINNKNPQIRAMHAGLECGAFKVKAPDLQMITVGPTIEECHSPDEKLNIPSVEKFWNFLITLLNQL
jgi:dipeptidase D